MKLTLLSYSLSRFLSAQLSGSRRVFKLVVVMAFLWVGVCGIGYNRLHASCITLDDVPLDTQQQTGSGIIMLVIDDSGSMDWEVLCRGNDQGTFNVGSTGYYYVFKDAGDNVFSGQVLEGTSNANKWMSQWCGDGNTDTANQMFYNPAITYIPWITYSNADANNPRSNPVNSSDTLDLSVVYSFFPVKIIDNSSSSFSKTGTWSSTKTSPSGYYGSNYIYSTAAGSTATWSFSSLTAGNYDVAAQWPASADYNSSSVQFAVNNTNVPIVNQRSNGGQWNRIASDKTFTTSGTVKLTVPNPNTGSKRHCADAIALGIAIHRSHYYIKKDNVKYLVDMNASTSAMRYYRYAETDGDDNVELGELTPLTLAEATAAGIVTGRTYADERQNFANWYSFYRRRMLTAKNAISKVVAEMNGVYIGIITINQGVKKIALPVNVFINNVQVLPDGRSELLTTLFNLSIDPVKYFTPLRNGLDYAGRYFKGAYGKPSPLPSDFFASNTYPFFTTDKGGACQQAFTIVVTDGYWNTNTPYDGTAVGNADGVPFNTVFDGDVYKDTYTDVLTMADIAMYYYENDLNSVLNNNVPININDTATHQHMVTYGLSFGVEGTIDMDTYGNCPHGLCPPSWPKPVSNDQTTIDDLFHATVNGRGKYVSASNPEEMVSAMNLLKEDIQSRQGSSASLATNSIQRQVGTTIYQSTYNTAGWSGDVKALELSVETGAVGGVPVWQASEHVPAWNSRNILSYNGSGGIIFSFGNISASQRAYLPNADLVDFIRGDVSHNLSHGGLFRVRTQVFGDFIHSAPVYYKGVVYIGSNDGMLHAVDAVDGNELFCYVPGMVYDHLSELAVPGYSHKYYVDGTPAVARVGDRDILVCGLGKGGKGYFGLDVTHPDAMTPENVLWEFPSGTDDDMGYSFSQPMIVKTKAAGWTVVFGNGYDSVSENAVLYLVNPVTGIVIEKLDTLTENCNGLSTPKVVDVDGDVYADYAFAGDLKGNLWKFDLRGNTSDDWKVYYKEGSVPKPLILVRNDSDIAQAITAAPEVMLDCAKSGFANSGTGLMVIFGTGRYLNSSDLSNTTPTQSFYGIWDWGDAWENKSGYDVAKTHYLGEASGSDRTLSNVFGKSLLEQTMGTPSGDWVTLSANTVNWYNPEDTTGNPGDHMGWFFDLPTVGERGIREPMLRMGVAVLISTIPSSSPCQAGGSSVLYQVSACKGGRTEKSQFDVNGDNVIGENDLIGGLPPTGKEYDQILFEPIEIGNILYLSGSLGGTSRLPVPANLVGMQFWRIIQ